MHRTLWSCNRFWIFWIHVYWTESLDKWGLLKLCSFISPLAKFSILRKYSVRFFESHSYLTSVTAAELRRHVPNVKRDIQYILCFLTNLKISENNWTEEIGLLTPTPELRTDGCDRSLVVTQQRNFSSTWRHCILQVAKSHVKNIFHIYDLLFTFCHEIHIGGRIVASPILIFQQQSIFREACA